MSVKIVSKEMTCLLWVNYVSMLNSWSNMVIKLISSSSSLPRRSIVKSSGCLFEHIKWSTCIFSLSWSPWLLFYRRHNLKLRHYSLARSIIIHQRDEIVDRGLLRQGIAILPKEKVSLVVSSLHNSPRCTNWYGRKTGLLLIYLRMTGIGHTLPLTFIPLQWLSAGRSMRHHHHQYPPCSMSSVN